MAVAPGALLPPLLSWLVAVNRTVTEPYLVRSHSSKVSEYSLIVLAGRSLPRPPGAAILRWQLPGLGS